MILAFALAVAISPIERRLAILAHMVPGTCISTAELRAGAGGIAMAVSETTIRADAQWLADQGYPMRKAGTSSKLLWCR